MKLLCGMLCFSFFFCCIRISVVDLFDLISKTHGCLYLLVKGSLLKCTFTPNPRICFSSLL